MSAPTRRNNFLRGLAFWVASFAWDQNKQAWVIIACFLSLGIVLAAAMIELEKGAR
jgi:hypothetical protein